MTKPLILLTGSTGHIGYRVLLEALTRNYPVRCAVRSPSKQAALLATLPAQHHDQLTFTIVPDISASSAFDAAVKDATYVIHVASPLAVPTTEYERDIIQPAVRGTLSILASAAREPSVKKVVITSSVAAVMPAAAGAVFDADSRQPDPQGPWMGVMHAYAASKKIAYNRTREWMEEAKPGFEVVHVMPSFVLGPSGLAGSREEMRKGSNSLLLANALGGADAELSGAVCHVDDVAWVHLEALREDLRGNRCFGVSFGGKWEWEDAKEVVRRVFPAAVEGAVVNLGGNLKTGKNLFDASKTEKELGREFKGFQTMVRDVLEQYLSLK